SSQPMSSCAIHELPRPKGAKVGERDARGARRRAFSDCLGCKQEGFTDVVRLEVRVQDKNLLNRVSFSVACPSATRATIVATGMRSPRRQQRHPAGEGRS